MGLLLRNDASVAELFHVLHTRHACTISLMRQPSLDPSQNKSAAGLDALWQRWGRTSEKGEIGLKGEKTYALNTNCSPKLFFFISLKEVPRIVFHIYGLQDILGNMHSHDTDLNRKVVL